jgi:hypothetical protein
VSWTRKVADVNSRADEHYQRFKWAVLSDAVYEDDQGLWEPLWYANSLFPELEPAEREELAERALRELFGAGLIAFFRIGGASREKLDPQAVDAAITGSSWRPVPPEDTSIWFGGTEAGKSAVREHGR